jgi:hypothetical protein
MEDDITFCKNGGGQSGHPKSESSLAQSGHPKSESSLAQSGFKRDKKRKWEKLLHKHRGFQEKKLKKS